jgi:hypothetical protein
MGVPPGRERISERKIVRKEEECARAREWQPRNTEKRGRRKDKIEKA